MRNACWQVDADELWTVEQIFARKCSSTILIKQRLSTGAGILENLVISTRNCYAQNPQQEWLRTWRYKPGQSGQHTSLPD